MAGEIKTYGMVVKEKHLDFAPLISIAAVAALR